MLAAGRCPAATFGDRVRVRVARTRPRTAPATPGPALMELARLQSAAMFAPDPPIGDEASSALGTGRRDPRVVAPHRHPRCSLAPPPAPAV